MGLRISRYSDLRDDSENALNASMIRAELPNPTHHTMETVAAYGRMLKQLSNHKPSWALACCADAAFDAYAENRNGNRDVAVALLITVAEDARELTAGAFDDKGSSVSQILANLNIINSVWAHINPPHPEIAERLWNAQYEVQTFLTEEGDGSFVADGALKALKDLRKAAGQDREKRQPAQLTAA